MMKVMVRAFMAGNGFTLTLTLTLSTLKPAPSSSSGMEGFKE